MLTIIMGKTCSGKTTIVNELKKYGFHPIGTYTTRTPRKGDTYHFISELEFLDKVSQGFFAEYKSYKTPEGVWHYGTARSDIENAQSKDIIILTPEGVRDLIKAYPTLDYRLIYIYTNKRTMKNRLMKRGDKKEEVERRIRTDDADFKGVESLADKIVYNNDGDNFSGVVDKIRKYIEVNG